MELSILHLHVLVAHVVGYWQNDQMAYSKQYALPSLMKKTGIIGYI